MGLYTYVDRYALTHDVGASMLEQLRIAAKLFCEWSGISRLDQLEDDLLNAWLLHRKNSGLRPQTVRGNRTAILMLWRAAAAEGLVEEPKRIRLIKCPDVLIEGYDAGQMAALIAGCESLSGRFRGSQMPRRVWWRSLLLTYWDSSLRLGDLLSIERGWIWPAPGGMGTISIIQAKTGRGVSHSLRVETMAAIDECMRHGGERRMIWAGFLGRRYFYRAFKSLAKSVGLAGTSKWIRRGSSSEVEKLCPGAGRRHVGHKSADTWEKHYKVDRICKPPDVLPPPIG